MGHLNMGMPQMGMQVGGANQNNPYAALAMNNFATMNALQQLNPALAAAAMQNPAMNAMLTAQLMSAQQAQARAIQQQQQQQQKQGSANGSNPGMIMAPNAFAPGMAPGQVGGLQQQQQQQMGLNPGMANASAPGNSNQESSAPAPVNGQGTNAGAAAGPGTSVSNSNANANANYAEYLSRKATMERQQQQLQLQQLQLQQQQQAMLMGNNAISTPAITGNNADDKSNAPSNTGGKDQDDCVAV